MDSLTLILKIIGSKDFVWNIKVGADNKYIVITPEADYIAVGSFSPTSHSILLSGDGEVLWKAKSFDNIFAVTISHNGEYVIFSSRIGNLYIYPNPPKSG